MAYRFASQRVTSASLPPSLVGSLFVRGFAASTTASRVWSSRKFTTSFSAVTRRSTTTYRASNRNRVLNQAICPSAFYSTREDGRNDAVLADLLQKSQFRKVANALDNDPRVKLSYSEYLDLCKSHGLAEGEANELLRGFHQSGRFLHYPHSDELKDFVLLKPDELAGSFARLLDVKGTLTRRFTEERRQELETWTKELADLEEKNTRLTRKAESRANQIIWAGLGFLVLQGSAVARLTWWELSWDIMEPVTYMLTFTTIVATMAYFAITKTEYTYEALHTRLTQKRLEKLKRRSGFDTARYEELKALIARNAQYLQGTDLDLLRSPEYVAQAAAGSTATGASPSTA